MATVALPPTLFPAGPSAPRPKRWTCDEFHQLGDLGWFDEYEFLHFTGRINNIIKTSGASVSPLEIEGALVLHPQIDFAAVVGVPDEALGEIVVACVVASPGAALTQQAVRDFLTDRLSSYKIPRRVLFFPDQSELPRTASNKFSVNAIRELVSDILDPQRDG